MGQPTASSSNHRHPRLWGSRVGPGVDTRRRRDDAGLAAVVLTMGDPGKAVDDVHCLVFGSGWSLQ
ncbi:uncharacterized protein FOMMEDRAFT_151681 [Fomitiporia mediterranea MF3/22]|uniref:uncharacterized protein n=1 Tax=Fomitiporia mediterranea (strain MF3/22) TaxID=694068 RepID=UPI00044090FC|nr:uncharacterized protein FOMMEDRAFT_151681 [Fomitiporia mediterranea MF3/22]EJD06419.1 hypothetical protein FOMMEDRAFT_151681 [Fomitiporia mediterranea MF3/22]